MTLTELSNLSHFLKPPEAKDKENISLFFRFFRNMLRGKTAEEGEERGKVTEKERQSGDIGDLEMTEDGRKVITKEGNSEVTNNKEIPLVNRVLLPEMLEKIFGYLAAKDLNNVMLVCKIWNNIGESPGLWSMFKITKNSQLSSKRLQVCQEFFVGHSWNGARTRGGDFNLGEISQNILWRPAVKKITLSFSSAWEHMRLTDDWFRIKGDLLIEAVAKVEELVILGTISGNRDNKAEANQGAIAKCVVDAILDRPNNLKRLMLNKMSYKMGVD